MEWTRSDTLALASHSCALCQGLGLRFSAPPATSLASSEERRVSPPQPCNCVLRNIFRACYARFRDCASKERFISQVSLESVRGCDTRKSWGRKDEEYIADFYLVSRRSLNKNEYRIFKYHYLLGADWRLCCRKLNMDRGNFFHAIYKIEQRLGRVFRELKPYALFPLKDYFSNDVSAATPFLHAVPAVVPIRPPLAPLNLGFEGRHKKVA